MDRETKDTLDEHDKRIARLEDLEESVGEQFKLLLIKLQPILDKIEQVRIVKSLGSEVSSLIKWIAGFFTVYITLVEASKHIFL